MLGVEHVLLVGSGTYAVELGLRALQVGPRDEVVLASYDYPGNFLCVHAVGATPVLVDIEPGNWALAVGRAAEALTPATKAIVVSHLHGGMADMQALVDLARQHGVNVLEDAAQCPGAVVQGRPVGTWGDAGVWSFGGSKLLCAGRGGALFTKRGDVFQRARTHWLRGNIVSPLSQLQAAALLPQLDSLQERNSAVARMCSGSATCWRTCLDCGRCATPRQARNPRITSSAFSLTRPHSACRAIVSSRRCGRRASRSSEGFAAQHVGRSPRRFRKGSDLAESECAHHSTVILHHPVLLDDAGTLQVAAAVRKVHHHRDLLAKAGDVAYAGRTMAEADGERQ